MLKPLENRVVLKVNAEEEKTVGGFVLAGNAQEKPQVAEVIATGPGLVVGNGQVIETGVQAGDRVIFEKFAGTVVKDGEEEYLVVRSSDILAIVE